MADAASPKRNVPPGRKGGTRYPKHSLDQVLPLVQKLVGKTHLGPIARDVLFAGVLGSSGSNGEIKASSLKQFGLLEGQSKAYTATDLAKAINGSPPDELRLHLQESALSPAVFQQLYATFHGDVVPVSKVRQRAIELKVHPDLAGECVTKYIASLTAAELGQADGSSFAHGLQPATNMIFADATELAKEPLGIINDDQETEPDTVDQTIDQVDDNRSSPRAVFHVNVNLDASLDTDKLERHLKLLKQYGAI